MHVSKLTVLYLHVRLYMGSYIQQLYKHINHVLEVIQVLYVLAVCTCVILEQAYKSTIHFFAIKQF